MFIFVKSIASVTLIYADNIDRMHSVLMLRVNEINIKMMCKLNLYTVLLNVLLMTFLLLFKLNCINSRLFSHLTAFIMIFK